MAYDTGQGDGAGGERRTTLPLIDEWGEMVLNDEMITEPTATGMKPKAIVVN